MVWISLFVSGCPLTIPVALMDNKLSQHRMSPLSHPSWYHYLSGMHPLYLSALCLAGHSIGLQIDTVRPYHSSLSISSKKRA